MSRYRWERWSAVHAQHLTVHQASWFNHNPGYSTVHLVNSLLVGVTNPGYYSGVSVGIESSGAGVFEPVGGGDHYLQLGSPQRNVEQPLNWGGGGIDSHLAINPYHASGTAPVVECRFTDFVLLAYAGSHLYTQSAGWVIGQLVLRDCGLRGGNVTLGGPSATAVELKNSLWQAVSASFFGAGSLQAHHTLGRYYQHLASSLRNAGSRPVTTAGLAHYTTTSDYAKDTGQVDIGLHYVATTNGQPIDTDGDGLPDYVEDADGDGQVGATETDPSNVDTDGDELSDGAEVEVTGTDPLDPASKNHNQEYVRYSIAHPLWKSAQSSGTGVITTEAKLLVARGVDALCFYVEVSTTEPASTRPTYNDHLTYLIQSPLIGIVGGTFNIAALGSQNPLVIFPPEWRVCHAKTLTADS